MRGIGLPSGRSVESQGVKQAGGPPGPARFALALVFGLCIASPAGAGDMDAHVRGLLDVVAAPNNTDITLNTMNAGATMFDSYTLRLFAEGKPADEIEVYTQVIASDVTGLWVYGAYAIFTPNPKRDLHLQAGKIPWPIGTFGPRTYSNKNPLMGVPLLYQYHTSLRDDEPAGSADALLAMAGQGQFGVTYSPGGFPFRGMPIVYDHCWDVGAVVLGSVRPIEFSAGVTNGTPGASQAGRDDNDGKSVMGRLGYTPIAGLRLGVSGSIGPYMPNSAESGLPPGKDAENFGQRLVMADFEYLLGHAELRAEGVASTWETPFVGNPAVHGYYVEGKYSFPVGLYLAARWDELRFTPIQGSSGPRRPWDDNVRRFEGGVGYRIRKTLLAKAVYQSTTLDPGPPGNQERRYDLTAATLSIGF